ncbi:hypothetical protein FJZ18_04720 [Candidatus Pacearchaeota archaeon]|nr:hypothetical protein [Candidatus Pacearchaeota archaeon]
MNKFDFGGIEPVYKSPDDKIIFIPNPECFGAYDVAIGNRDHLYIPNRTLENLTNPRVDTQRMMQLLETMSDGVARFILETNRIDPRDFHIALLHLRNIENERELRYAYGSRQV